MLNPQEIAWAKNAISQIGFLQGLSEQESIQLINSLGKKYFRPGQTIVFQGEISSNLFFVYSGKVSINVREKGKTVKVAELGPGKYFGEISLIEPTSAKATVKAEENCEILNLSYDNFRMVVDKRPEILDIIKQTIAARKEANVKSMGGENK